MKVKNNKQCMFCSLYVIFSFLVIDFWLRILTKELGLYDICALPPNLFSLFWSLVFFSLIYLIPKKQISIIIYAILYFCFSIYAIVQYGYYLIFKKFLFLSDFMYAGEGSDYLSYVFEIITFEVIIQVFILLFIGLIGVAILCNRIVTFKNKKWILIVTMIVSVLGINCTPKLYDILDNQESKNYQEPSFEYSRFVNSAYDMQLTGVYQYIARDTYLNINKQNVSDCQKVETFKEIETYFAKKKDANSNEMTGWFAGKNIIVVMMESIDDWLVTEEDMPTVYYMMKNGINFTNFYTPNYSSGYTINTEFAFNTSIYPLSTENYVETLINNNFDNSIANIFKSNGYTVNSFHMNTSDFYNRGQLHKTLGYEKYYSYYDYGGDFISVADDKYLYLCDELYKDVINEEKGTTFMSFVITASAHLPYLQDSPLFIETQKKYPQYAQGEITEETILRASAHITDDMFAGLLKRLEEDNLLEDTVIVAFGDHYSYGINDKELLQKRSEEAGNSILENTPAFIYCAGMENSITVDKVTQITDLAPTIENLFGFKCEKETMGNDAFDKNYIGYAIFPNNTWIINDVYMKNGTVVFNKGVLEVEILHMNEFVQSTYLVNDYLLKYDYYNKEE